MPLKKVLRFSLFALLIIVIIVLGINTFASLYLNKMIKARVQTEIDKATNGEYKLLMGRMWLNVAGGSLMVKNVRFIPNFPVKEYENSRYSVTADKIVIENFSLWNFLRGKDLTFSRTAFINPEIKIYQSTVIKVKDEKDTVPHNFPLYKIIKSQVNSVTIDLIQIKKSKLSIYRSYADTNAVFTGTDNTINIKNFKVNETCERTNHIFMADKVEVAIKEFAYQIEDLYALEGTGLNASYTDSIVTIDSIKLIPKFNKQHFAEKVGHQTDRIKLTSGKISFEKMNVKLFFERNWLLAGTLEINNIFIGAYRDKNFVREEKEIKSLQKVIRDIPVLVKINEIHLHNSTIVYEELSPNAELAGKIFFKRVNATIKGFSNDSLHYSSKSELEVYASAYFLDKAKMTSTYTFPLNTTQSIFNGSGRMNSMPFSALNELMQNTAHIHAKAGTLDSMVFTIQSNNNRSNGEMGFFYHDLKIEVEKKDSEKSGLKEKMKSFVLNKFMIDSDNPSKGSKPRITSMNYVRNPNRFIFNNVYNTLLSGIKPALGLKERSVKKIKNKKS